MKQLITSLIILFLLLASQVFAQKNTSQGYVQKVEVERKEKNKKFKHGEDSPLPEKDRRKFKSLYYYPVDSTYQVKATFVRDSTQLPFKMKTSTDRLPEYVKYGEMHFNLQGKPYVLTVYQNLELIKKEEYKDYLFIPFTDETNGFDTHGGGRYLDFRIPSGNTVEIDFNSAYNPYCAYSPNYSCPIPPKENYLQTKILAGEKNYK